MNVEWYPHGESVYLYIDGNNQLKLYDVRENKDNLVQTPFAVENFTSSKNCADIVYITDN